MANSGSYVGLSDMTIFSRPATLRLGRLADGGVTPTERVFYFVRGYGTVNREGNVVLDTAGGDRGGAARWRYELDLFLQTETAVRPQVEVIGRGRFLTTAWLVRRERRARAARMTIAANNVTFAFAGEHRRVLLRNMLHFLSDSEADGLGRMPPGLRAQVPVVRRMAARADLVVTPSSAMAERVELRVPSVRGRLVVRPHPVTTVGPRLLSAAPFVLMPVNLAPHKNMVPNLTELVAALDRSGLPLKVWVTVHRADLPPPLARHPRVMTLGRVPHHRLARMWQEATAAFFPSTMESFGYPLAEARVYGVPVLAANTALAREIAGAALVPYRPGDPASLTAALEQLAVPVPAEPDAFDRDAYFQWLLAPPAAG